MSLILRVFHRRTPALLCRSFHSSQPNQDDGFSKMMYKLHGYCKYGLLHDDLLWETNPIVAEAIRRLPEEEQMKRIYRAIRAQQYEIMHDILPEDEWTKFEENHYYLRPYMAEIKKEIEEREEWEANH